MVTAMSDLPPTIDAILESIRARVTAAEAPPPPSEPAPAAAPEPAVPDLAQVAVPPPGAGTTLDQLIRDLLEPMLQRWMDANLPEIVEKVAQAEVRRLTGRG